METTQHRIVVVGTGFAGIGMAVRLKQAGYDDFVVLERADDVGGTWRDNTYPGCRCDVPSHLYSFSFAPNPEWSSTFSPQPEIEDYLRKVTDRFGIRPHIRFGHAVETARWEDGRWRIQTSQGEFIADVLLSGMGPLAEPSYPKLAWDRVVRGRGLPLGAVGSRPGPEWPQGRGDRDRRVGDPVRAGDPARGRGTASVPADAAVGDAAAGPQDHRGGEGGLPSVSRWRRRRSGPGSTGVASRWCSGSPSCRRS